MKDRLIKVNESLTVRVVEFKDEMYDVAFTTVDANGGILSQYHITLDGVAMDNMVTAFSAD
jgi:hypothetical protein